MSMARLLGDTLGEESFVSISLTLPSKLNEYPAKASAADTYLAALAVIGNGGGNREVEHLALRRKAEAGVVAQPAGALLEGRG